MTPTEDEIQAAIRSLHENNAYRGGVFHIVHPNDVPMYELLLSHHLDREALSRAVAERLDRKIVGEGAEELTTSGATASPPASE